jgi:hypothetical protein
MMKANGWLKGMQTVNNPASQIRNLVGNTLFATANGHVHVGEMANAIDIVARKGKNEKLVEQLIRGGVLSSDIITSDIADITRKSFGFFTKDVEKMSSKQLNKMISNLPNNIQQRLYQAEDDVWKVYGYLNELKRGYSPKEAMENTKLIYPNYNNLPRVIEKFREIPYVGSAIGTFTAFPTAVVQNAASTLKLATKEMAGKTSLGKRSFGRAIGVGAIGGYYLGRNKFADMYNQMTGGGEAFNEWGMSTDETARLMQKYGSPWEEYAEILPTRIVDLEGGAKGIEYFNNSYLNPWSTVSEPLTALSRGEYSDAAYQALQPYVDPSMLTSMMTALFTGKDDNNKTIRSKHDDSINNVANMVTFMAKRISPWAMAPDILKIKADLKSGDFDISKFVPGTGTYIQGVGYQAQRFQKAADGVVDEYGKKYTVGQEAKNIMTGTRKQVFVPRQSMKSNLFTAKDAYNLSMRGAMSKLHNESDSNIIKMYQAEGEQYRQGAFNQMREVITDFKKFGLSDEEIRGVLDELNVSNRMKRDLETGVYRPYRPSRKTTKAIRDGREKRNLNKFEFDF